MYRDTAVARVKLSLGFKTNQDENIVQAMKEAQELLENKPELPGFLRVRYEEGFTTYTGERFLDVPDGFIREWDQDQMAIEIPQYSKTKNLLKDSPGYLRIRYPNSGVPVGYSLVERQFHFFPVPDAEYQIRGTYYAADDILNSNIENGWLRHFPQLIWSMAGFTVASALRDKDALAIFDALQKAAYSDYINTTVSDDAAGSRPVVGGED